MRDSQERREALVAEVKTLLKEQGKSLDPEMLARLAAAQNGMEEDRLTRFAGLWRRIQLPFTLLLIGLIGLLFYFLLAK